VRRLVLLLKRAGARFDDHGRRSGARAIEVPLATADVDQASERWTGILPDRWREHTDLAP
jgi:hypothetical protein